MIHVVTGYGTCITLVIPGGNVPFQPFGTSAYVPGWGWTSGGGAGCQG
jgi:hypothetical protein